MRGWASSIPTFVAAGSLIYGVVACQSTLSYYGDKEEDLKPDDEVDGTADIDTAEPTDGETTTDGDDDDVSPDGGTTTDEGDADTDADSDTDADGDVDTDTDGDVDTDTDGDTDTGTPPPPPLPLVDGHYIGDAIIHYELNVPLIGGSADCEGPVDIIVDQTMVTNPYYAMTGTINCSWPPLNLWANVIMALGDVTGVLDGSVAGSVVAGSTSGQDSTLYFTWSDVWTGVGNGTNLSGSFQENSFGMVTSGSFTAIWIGPP